MMCWICEADWMTPEEQAKQFRMQAQAERAQWVFIAVCLGIGAVLAILEELTGPWF